MKPSKRTLRWGAATASIALMATLPSGLALASAPKPVSVPTIKLTVAQKTITAPRFGKNVFIDPGVYVTALGSQLQFDVQRASYAKPIRGTEVTHLGSKVTVEQPVPSWAIHSFAGLAKFIRVTIKNSHGKIVASQVRTFCPNNFNPQRAASSSPRTSPFPEGCTSDPFEKGMVFGIQKGWGSDALTGAGGFGNLAPKLPLGIYKVIVNITKPWQRLLHISKFDAIARVRVKVIKEQNCIDCFAKRPKRTQTGRALPKLPAVATLTSPPAAVLPDLVPLPSYDIRAFNLKATKTSPARSQLSFAATVSSLGQARLDVEGFRSNGSEKMKAYQYFFRDGRAIGRAPVGTMGFSGYNKWHFSQFAQYKLLNARKKVVISSDKVGFCIAPTDGVNLTLPGATWQPSFVGLSGACGSETALSVQEEMPVGWGDTYFQFIPGQSFNISHLANGTYYVEIIANPGKRLHETNLNNDVSLRKVIIGGTSGHRTVRVPAVHGINPER